MPRAKKTVEPIVIPTEKSMIDEKIVDLSLEWLTGPLDVVCEKISALKDQYSSHTNLQLQLEYYYDYTELNLVGSRLQTDEEFNITVERAKKLLALQEKNALTIKEKELQELVRLQKKYKKELAKL